jgi:hypothetical protein
MSWAGYNTSIAANRYKQMFITNYLDISGDLLVNSGDVSFNNGNLYVAGNVGIGMVANSGYELDVAGDVRNNGNLFVMRDISLNGNLTIGSDVTMNKRLFTVGDVSLNSKLFVAQDTSLNGNLFVTGDGIYNGNLLVKGNLGVLSTIAAVGDFSCMGNAAINGNLHSISNFYSMADAQIYGNLNATFDTSLNSRLVVGSDITTNKRLFTVGDASLNAKLFVALDTSLNGNLRVGKDLTILGRLNVQNYTNTNIINTTVNNYQLIVSEDLSLNGRLVVSGDTSFNGSLFAVTQLTIDNSTKVATTAYARNLLDASLSNYYTKTAIDSSINTSYYNKAAIDASINTNYYNKTAIDANLATYYTKTAIDASINTSYYNKTAIDASINTSYYNKTAIDASINASFYNKTAIDASINASFYNKTAIDASINASFYNKAAIDASINTSYYNKTAIDASVNTALALKSNIASPTFTGTAVIPTANITTLNTFGDASMNGNLRLGSDITINKRLFTVGDASLNGNLFVALDTSLNGNLVVGKDLTINGRLNVKNYTNNNIINTTVNNYQLIVSEDLSLNGRLVAAGDSSFNGNLYVAGTITAASYAANSIPASAIIGGVGSSGGSGGSVSASGDLSMNGNLYVGKNIGIGLVATSIYDLDVSGDARIIGNIFGTYDCSINGNISMNGNLSILSSVNAPFNSYTTYSTLSSVPSTHKYQAIGISDNGQYVTVADTSNGYIYVSNNYGSTFTQITTMNSLYWNAVAVSGNGATQLACVRYENLPATTSGKVYISTNYGVTWTQASGVVGCGNYPAVAMSTTGQYIFLAGTSNTTLQKSSDYGATWSTVSAWTYGNISGIFMTRNNGTSLYVNHYKSTNYGTSFTATSFPFSGAQVTTSDDESIIFGGVGSTVYLSTNSGSSYTTLATATAPFNTGNWNPGASVYYNVSSNGAYLSVFSAVSGYLIYSTNSGTSWSSLSVGIQAGQQYIPCSMANNGDIYIGDSYFTSGGTVTNGVKKLSTALAVTKAFPYKDSSLFVSNNSLQVACDASYNGNLSVGRSFRTTRDISVNSLRLGRGGGTTTYSSAFGFEALSSNTGGEQNTAIGYQTLKNNITGNENTAVGYGAGINSTGSFNTAVGSASYFGMATSSYNAALGYAALYNCSSGGTNTGIGAFALRDNTTGSTNTAIGGYAGYSGTANTTGSNNTYIGYAAQANANNYSSSTAIGTGAIITGSNQIVLGRSTEKLIVPGDASFNGNIKAGGNVTAAAIYASSDYRIKSNIKLLSDTSFSIDLLKPITYINAKIGRQDIGFIAHEVQQQFPFLVTGEKDGPELQSVNYTGIIGLLTNEIQELKKQNIVLNEKIKNIEDRLSKNAL